MNSKGTIYINAIGIGSGGGLRLLEALVTQVHPTKNCHFFFDGRISITPKPRPNLSWEFVSGSKKERFLFEFLLRKRITPDDTLFCFNNIPPLLRHRGRTVVYIQNRHILQPFVQKGLAAREQVRWRSAGAFSNITFR